MCSNITVTFVNTGKLEMLNIILNHFPWFFETSVKGLRENYYFVYLINVTRNIPSTQWAKSPKKQCL